MNLYLEKKKTKKKKNKNYLHPIMLTMSIATIWLLIHKIAAIWDTYLYIVDITSLPC